MFLAALLLMLPAAVPARAAEAAVWVFLYADRESRGSYTPANQTASRGHIQATVARHGTGSYTVDLANAGAPGVTGVPVVTAVDDAGVHCQLAWFYLADDETTEVVEVACYAGTVPTDSRFTLSYFRSTPPDSGASGAYGYVFDNQPAATTYSAAPSYNSAGGPVTIHHAAGTNIWTVRFAGRAFDNVGGNVQVSAVGIVPMRCSVYQWYPVSNPPGVDAQVRCDRLSTPAYTPQWTLTYTHDRSIVGGTSGFFGYLQANQPGSAFYVPDPGRNRAADPAYVHTVTRSNPGRYQAQVYGPFKEPMTAHVSVNGDTGNFCDIGSWSVTPSTQPAGRVDITCYNAAGGPADSWFSLNYFSP
jgi:hypothetical protein